MSRTTLTLKSQRRLLARIAENLPDGLSEEDAIHWIENSSELSSGLSSLLVRSEVNWLDHLLQAEDVAHRAFFGQTSDLTQFAATLERFGEERVRLWTKDCREPHFLPKQVFSADTKLRGWKVKPEPWFWQKIADGKIMRRDAAGKLAVVKEVGFDGVTLLIDTRCKPAYTDGSQMFANDGLLGGVIKTLRAEGKIASLNPSDSRFCISSREWDEQIRPALETLPEFAGVSFRLELAIEANVIPQMYKRMPRRKDGQTDTRVWYEEFFEDALNRLNGGYSGRGGLASVYYSGVDDRWNYRAVRPVGVLDSWTV